LRDWSSDVCSSDLAWEMSAMAGVIMEEKRERE
jgi:hypothetical protein